MEYEQDPCQSVKLYGMVRQYVFHWIGGGAGTMLLSAASRALPEPLPMGNRFYLFVYRLVHILMANADLVQQANATANGPTKSQGASA